MVLSQQIDETAVIPKDVMSAVFIRFWSSSELTHDPANIEAQNVHATNSQPSIFTDDLRKIYLKHGQLHKPSRLTNFTFFAH